MLRVNDKEWEIEVNGFPVGHLFGSLRTAFQKFHDPQDGTMAHILRAQCFMECSKVIMVPGKK